MKARFAVVAIVTVGLSDTKVNSADLFSKPPDITAVYEITCGVQSVTVTRMFPSTEVQPFTSKETVSVEPAVADTAFVSIEPVELPPPILTAPPAWYAAETYSMLVLPDHDVEDPEVDVLFPLVMDEKFSESKVEGVPLPVLASAKTA